MKKKKTVKIRIFTEDSDVELVYSVRKDGIALLRRAVVEPLIEGGSDRGYDPCLSEIIVHSTLNLPELVGKIKDNPYVQNAWVCTSEPIPVAVSAPV